MKPSRIVYFIREAFRSLARNRLLSIATISTVAISILILGIAVLMTINAGSFMNRLESDVQIVAFLDKSLSSSELSEIQEEIESLEGVKSVRFVSQDEALKKLQKSYGTDYDLKDTIGKNPLPNTLDIKARDPHKVPTIARQVDKTYGVYKVNYGQGVVERLFNVTRWVRVISLGFIVLLAAGAVFLIATTIRLAIFSRRKEIYLMKLIGATNWFIRWPFFIEGIILAGLGGLLAIALLAAGYGSLINRMGTLVFITLVTDSALLLNIYLGLLGTAVILGILGTFISLNRFLDV
ncbi:permease-like cell division protein FtsX [Syntrophomonas erecta]